jgi:hypothetical protein
MSELLELQNVKFLQNNFYGTIVIILLQPFKAQNYFRKKLAQTAYALV